MKKPFKCLQGRSQTFSDVFSWFSWIQCKRTPRIQQISASNTILHKPKPMQLDQPSNSNFPVHPSLPTLRLYNFFLSPFLKKLFFSIFLFFNENIYVKSFDPIISGFIFSLWSSYSIELAWLNSRNNWSLPLIRFVALKWQLMSFCPFCCALVVFIQKITHSLSLLWTWHFFSVGFFGGETMKFRRKFQSTLNEVLNRSH